MSAAELRQQDASAHAVRRRGRFRRLTAAAVGAVMLLGVALTGCAVGPAEPAAPVTATSAAASPSEKLSATPDPDPALSPDGSASENLAYFNSLATAVTKANPAADGRAYIDALVVGGFDRTAMEVTFDRTQAGLVADAVQFSVRFAGECLIGQIGPASDGFRSMVAPILSTGLCLVGSTRQIDW